MIIQLSNVSKNTKNNIYINCFGIRRVRFPPQFNFFKLKTNTMKTLKEIKLENKIKRLEESSKAKDRIIRNLELLVEVLEDSNKFYKTLIKQND